MSSELFEHVVVVAENLHRKLSFGAFEHFVEAHLDRLREQDVVVGIDLLEDGVDVLAQLRLVSRPAGRFGPALDIFVENVNIALVGRHRVGSDLARPNARENACDLREILAQPILNFNVSAQRLLKAHPDRFVQHRGNRTLVQGGHEFRPKSREQPD